MDFIIIFVYFLLFVFVNSTDPVRARQKHVTVRVNIQQQPIFSFNTVIIWIKIFKCERGLQSTARMTLCIQKLLVPVNYIIMCQWVTPWTPIIDRDNEQPSYLSALELSSPFSFLVSSNAVQIQWCALLFNANVSHPLISVRAKIADFLVYSHRDANG